MARSGYVNYNAAPGSTRERMLDELCARLGLGTEHKHRTAALDAAVSYALIGQKERKMQEYFECQNCGQVVQGFVASQMVECCESPRYSRCAGPNEDERLDVAIPRPTNEDAARFSE